MHTRANSTVDESDPKWAPDSEFLRDRFDGNLFRLMGKEGSADVYWISPDMIGMISEPGGQSYTVIYLNSAQSIGLGWIAVVESGHEVRGLMRLSRSHAAGQTLSGESAVGAALVPKWERETETYCLARIGGALVDLSFRLEAAQQGEGGFCAELAVESARHGGAENPALIASRRGFGSLGAAKHWVTSIAATACKLYAAQAERLGGVA